jgi:hypothetical protein
MLRLSVLATRGPQTPVLHTSRVEQRFPVPRRQPPVGNLEARQTDTWSNAILRRPQPTMPIAIPSVWMPTVGAFLVSRLVERGIKQRHPSIPPLAITRWRYYTFILGVDTKEKGGHLCPPLVSLIAESCSPCRTWVLISNPSGSITTRTRN